MPREARTTAIQGERRRRKADTLDRLHGRKLNLPPECRDDPENDYYWANDTDDRIYSLTKEDDYDHVTRSNPESSEEEKVRRPVGTKESGEPLYAYLLKKPKAFADEDRAEKARRIDQLERTLIRSPKTDPEHSLPEGVTYTPDGNSIKRGPYQP